MSANNGHQKPIPFPQASVPIVGQAFTLKAGYATVLIQCNCEAHEPVMLIGNAPAQCPACRRTFMVASFAFDGQKGAIHAQIGLVAALPAVPPNREIREGDL